MKNVASYFNFNSDQTVLTSTSLEAVNVFLHTCAVPVQLNWSTVARLRQNCEVPGAPPCYLVGGADMLLDACISKIVFTLLDLWYVHFAEMVPSRLGSLPDPPLTSYFHLSPPKQKFLFVIPHSLLYLNAPSIITCYESMIM